MDAHTLNLIVSLISGLVGGNAVGAAMSEDKNLGTIGNSIAGLVGGGLGGWILKALGLFAAATVTTQGAPASSAFDLGTFIANVAGSGVGGAVLTALAGLIKNSIQKNS